MHINSGNRVRGLLLTTMAHNDQVHFVTQHWGLTKRRFLFNEEDLKIKFKKWMRLNLRQLTKKLAWGYLNTRLLKEVDEETLSSHNISLPIYCSTALWWMKN